MFKNDKFIRNNKYRIIGACSSKEEGEAVIEEIKAVEAPSEREYVKKITPILKAHNIKGITLIVDYYDIQDIDLYDECLHKYD